MHKIQITLVPTPAPEGEALPLAFTSRADSWEFPIANRQGTQFFYKHKVLLVNGGNVLQILSEGSDGRITEALPENAFDIASQPLKLTLIDIYDDGSDYKLLVETRSIEQSSSHGTLSGLFNPQLRIAEVSYMQNNNQMLELDFIGVEDIRMGLTARIMRRPGEAFEIHSQNGNITFIY